MCISFKFITNGWDAQPVIANGWDAQPVIANGWDAQPVIANGWDAQPVANSKWLGCTASLNIRVSDLNLLQMAGMYSQSCHVNTYT